MKKYSKYQIFRYLELLLLVGLFSIVFDNMIPSTALAQPENSNSSASSKPVNTSAQGQAKRVKFKKDTKVDFDDELIEGGVKNPFQSMIGGRDGDVKQGFIKIRREWHDQMIMSVNGLSQ